MHNVVSTVVYHKRTVAASCIVSLYEIGMALLQIDGIKSVVKEDATKNPVIFASCQLTAITISLTLFCSSRFRLEFLSKIP